MLTDSIPLALTFDDVLLVPRHSHVLPSDVDLSTRLAPSLHLTLPILSAAMDTVTEATLAIAMAKSGGLGVLHKNTSVEQQAEWVRSVRDADCTAAAAIGVGGDSKTRLAALVAAGVQVVVLDTAHGHSQGVLDRARAVRDEAPDVVLVLGNIATPEAVLAAAEVGANVVKVGVGPGSICTTRIVAGVGVPQLSAIAQCAAVAHAHGLTVIADGGIRTSGDLAKALAAGADAVMIGSMLAGTDESPGDFAEVNGERRKAYRGMGSTDAMLAGSSDRYFQSTANKLVPEGVAATVAAKGPAADVLYQMAGGLRSSMGYCGCPDVPAMQRDSRFVRITSAGLSESHVHDVAMIERPPNYR